MPAPRKPTALHVLSGAFKHDPKRARARENEPDPVGPIGDPPKRLSVKQRHAWAEHVAMAPWVTASHRGILELTSRLAVLVWEDKADGGDKRLYSQCLTKLGITPADNSRVQVPKKAPPGNEFQLLKGGRT